MYLSLSLHASYTRRHLRDEDEDAGWQKCHAERFKIATRGVTKRREIPVNSGSVVCVRSLGAARLSRYSTQINLFLYSSRRTSRLGSEHLVVSSFDIH